MNVTVMSFGAVWITVSWLEPVFIGVPALTRYEVSADPTNVTNTNVSSLSLVTPPQRAIVNVSSDMFYANISGLFPGQQYRLSIAALIQSVDVRARSNSSADIFITTHTTGNILLLKMVLIDPMLVSVLLLFGLINQLTWNLLEYGIHDLSNTRNRFN